MSVSIVMPTFNRLRYVERAINSVLCQTHSDFELIIVDDGSTDGTPDLLERYAKLDNRVHLIRQTNSGVTSSRNHGVSRAKFDLIAVMDDDDIMLPERIATQVAFLTAHPEVSAVSSFAYLIDDDENIIGKSCPEIDIERGKKELRPDLFLDIIHATATFRKSVFIEIGGYRSETLEDREMWGRFVTQGYKIAVQPMFLYEVRRHSTNISRVLVNNTSIYGDYIDSNVIRRLNCEPEISFDEYSHMLFSAPLLRRLSKQMKYQSRNAYHRATLYYANGEWPAFAGNLLIAFGLQPLPVIKRVAKKLI
jgi:glycosyltransferase involved in cell wall biosynthesis